MRLSQVIKKLPGQHKWRLYSKKTYRNLGTYDSRAAALKREREVQYFKHLRK
jgi:hypothetical protein